MGSRANKLLAHRERLNGSEEMARATFGGESLATDTLLKLKRENVAFEQGRQGEKAIWIALNELIIDQKLQWRRRGLNRDRVEAYLKDIEAWRAASKPVGFPPAKIYHIDGKYYVSDGFHRHQALLEADEREMLCVVFEGDFLAARKASALSNLEHGLENDELSKRDIMTFMMQPHMDWEHLSNGAIASVLRLSQTTIAAWIDQASKTGGLKTDRTKVQGRDGKWYEADKHKSKFTPEQNARKRQAHKLRFAVKAGWLSETEVKSGKWIEATANGKDTRLVNANTGEMVGGQRNDGGVLTTPNQPVFEKPSPEVIASLAVGSQQASVGIAFNQAEFNELMRAMDFSGKQGMKIVRSFRTKWTDNDIALFMNLMGQKLAGLYEEWVDVANECQLRVNGWEVG